MTAIDEQQLERLMTAHGAALTLYARLWCHSPEDALQESLVELLRQDPAPAQPVGWLYKTVRRRAMNVARSERRRADYRCRASRERESWFLPDVDRLERLDVRSYLELLPSLEREIVVARIWGELTFEQIAQLVDRPTSSVHRAYRTALRHMGAQMASNENDVRNNHESGISVTWRPA